MTARSAVETLYNSLSPKITSCYMSGLPMGISIGQILNEFPTQKSQVYNLASWSEFPQAFLQLSTNGMGQLVNIL